MNTSIDPFGPFREKVEAFIKRRGMYATDFGRQALGDPNFVFDLRNGRSCRAKTMQRVLAYMEKSK